jgi:hypothetical protein
MVFAIRLQRHGIRNLLVVMHLGMQAGGLGVIYGCGYCSLIFERSLIPTSVHLTCIPHGTTHVAKQWHPYHTGPRLRDTNMSSELLCGILGTNHTKFMLKFASQTLRVPG